MDGPSPGGGATRPVSVESKASWRTAWLILAILSVSFGSSLLIVVGMKPIQESLGTDRIARINQAVRHEALLSTLVGRVAPPPGEGPSMSFPHLRACLLVCRHYRDNRALRECDWLPLCATFARLAG